MLAVVVLSMCLVSGIWCLVSLCVACVSITPHVRACTSWQHLCPSAFASSSVSVVVSSDDAIARTAASSLSQDRTPTSDDFSVALCARQAYWLYQRQLWDNIPGSAITRSVGAGAGAGAGAGGEIREAEEMPLDIRGLPEFLRGTSVTRHVTFWR